MMNSDTVTTKTITIRPRVCSFLGLLITRKIAATKSRIPSGLAAACDVDRTHLYRLADLVS